MKTVQRKCKNPIAVNYFLPVLVFTKFRKRLPPPPVPDITPHVVLIRTPFIVSVVKHFCNEKPLV